MSAQAQKVLEFKSPDKSLSVQFHKMPEISDTAPKPGDHAWFEILDTTTGKSLFTEPMVDDTSANELVFVAWAKANSAVAISINLGRAGSSRVFRITDSIAKEFEMPKLSIPESMSPKKADVVKLATSHQKCKKWLDEKTVVIQVQATPVMRKGKNKIYGCDFTVRFDKTGKGQVIKIEANPSSEERF